MTNSQNYSGEVRWTKYIPLVYPISLLDLWKPAKYAEYLLILAYYLICWIWLNQCQPALQQYWISKVISLAEFHWINASQHYRCIEFQRQSVWLKLTESMLASTTNVLNVRGYQSGWFYLNNGQPLLLSRSVWLNLSESMSASIKISEPTGLGFITSHGLREYEVKKLRSPAFCGWRKRKLITQFHATHGK